MKYFKAKTGRDLKVSGRAADLLSDAPTTFDPAFLKANTKKQAEVSGDGLPMLLAPASMSARLEEKNKQIDEGTLPMTCFHCGYKFRIGQTLDPDGFDHFKCSASQNEAKDGEENKAEEELAFPVTVLLAFVFNHFILPLLLMQFSFLFFFHTHYKVESGCVQHWLAGAASVELREWLAQRPGGFPTIKQLGRSIEQQRRVLAGCLTVKTSIKCQVEVETKELNWLECSDCKLAFHECCVRSSFATEGKFKCSDCGSKGAD